MSDVVYSLEDIMTMADVFKTNGNQMRGQLRTLSNSLNRNIISQSHWSGATAVTVSNLVTNDHLPMIRALDNAYFKIGSKTRDLNRSFRNQMSETANNAIYHQGALNVFEQSMVDANNEKVNVDGEFRRIYRRIDDIMYLNMPNNNSYLNDWTQSRNSLTQTRRRLNEFTFDLDDVEELIDDIEQYVVKLERAAGTSLQGRQSVVSTRFRNNINTMHASIERHEAARLNELRASWTGRSLYEILGELPQPMTSAEQAAWELHVLEVTQGLDGDEAMNSFWSHFPEGAVNFARNNPGVNWYDSLNTGQGWLLEMIKKSPYSIQSASIAYVDSISWQNAVLKRTNDLTLTRNGGRLGNARRVSGSQAKKLRETTIPISNTKGGVGKALKGIGNGLTVVSAAITFGSQVNKRMNDGKDVYEAGVGAFVYAGAGVVGAKKAGAAGATTGAKIGAAIGSVIPGAGTIVGGAVGAVVGGAIGAIVGGGIASKIANSEFANQISGVVASGMRGLGRIGRAIGGIFN